MTSPEVPAVREASRRLVRELGFLDAGRRTHGMTHAQCHALLEIERAGACTASQLSDLLALDKSTVSRTVTGLLEHGLAAARPDPVDARKKRLVLTPGGKKALARVHAYANDQVERALATLEESERAAVVTGLALYAKALRRARLGEEIVLRPVRAADDPFVASIIRAVMPELGADGPGFAIHDAEVDAMSAAYRGPRAGYFVVERGGRVLGGAGFAPLGGGPRDVCELKKMYLLSEARGLGVGSRLLDRVLEAAARAGYARCYLETLDRMHDAQRLYVKKGFQRIEGPMGATGHFGCNRFYLTTLAPQGGARAVKARAPRSPRAAS